MSLESHDSGPEQSTPEKAQDYLKKLEAGTPLQLSSVMPKLGDDGSFVGRMNIITRNPSFVAAFNKNKPAGMPPLSTMKDAYGYKGTQEQNAVYIKTYLEMKAAGAEKQAPAKEVEVADPDKGPNMPTDSGEDLDDYLGFLPEKTDLNTMAISEVELRRRFDPTPAKAQIVTELNPSDPLSSRDATPITFTDLGPSVLVTREPLSEVLAKDPANERAATLVKALGQESGDLKNLFETWPMALATASTTVQEGIKGQGLNPYDTLANTVSASLINGAVVLTLKTGKEVTTALFPDSAWNPVDPSNKPVVAAKGPDQELSDLTDEELAAKKLAAQELAAKEAASEEWDVDSEYRTVKKEAIVDASFFTDPEDEFHFDDDVASAIADAKKANPEDKKAS